MFTYDVCEWFVVLYQIGDHLAQQFVMRRSLGGSTTRGAVEPAELLLGELIAVVDRVTLALIVL